VWARSRTRKSHCIEWDTRQ